jgi:hypothetical protein
MIDDEFFIRSTNSLKSSDQQLRNESIALDTHNVSRGESNSSFWETWKSWWNEPRSKNRNQTLSDNRFQVSPLGSSLHPISLLVQFSSHNLQNLVNGYALQHLIRASYNLSTEIFAAPNEVNLSEFYSSLISCFPNLVNLTIVSANDYASNERVAWHSLINKTDNLSGWTIDLQALLLNYSKDLVRNLTIPNDQKISSPFLLYDGNPQIQVDNGFQSIFNETFAMDSDSKSCHLFEPRDKLGSLMKEDGSSDNTMGFEVSNSSIGDKTFHIVVQLSGEMANQLCKFAYGFGLKWILEEDYNISTKVILRHQTHPKWHRARSSIVNCFPKLRNLDFSEGNTQEFDDRLMSQNSWLGENAFNLRDCESEKCIRQNLEAYINVILNTSNVPPDIPSDANITLPFIYADTYGMLGYINDRFFERFRFNWFEFDMNNPACCGVKSQLNETIVHARGYLQEMPRAGRILGFEELSPNKTVTEILHGCSPGDKVAVTSRYRDFGMPYVERMLSEKLDARFIETQNGEQAFCFLMSGTSDFIGNSRSTYAIWAVYLGNATRARIYSLRTPIRNEVAMYNFTNQVLRSKISFESYNSEEQDLIDQGVKFRRRLRSKSRNRNIPNYAK